MEQFKISKISKNFLNSYFYYNYYYSFNYFFKIFNFNPLNLDFSFFIGRVLNIKYLDINFDELCVKNFLGFCFSFKNNNLFSFFSIRNILKNDAFEISFFYYSPIILHISILQRYKKKYRLYKLYFIRK